MINKDMIYKLFLEWQRDRYDDHLIMIDDCEDFYNYIVGTLKAKTSWMNSRFTTATIFKRY